MQKLCWGKSQSEVALWCLFFFATIFLKTFFALLFVGIYISNCFQLSFCTFITISLYRSTQWGDVLSDWAFLFLCTCILSFQEIFMKKPCCKSKKIDIKSCENANVRIWECSFRNDSKWWKKWINGFRGPRKKLLCSKGEGDGDKLGN